MKWPATYTQYLGNWKSRERETGTGICTKSWDKTIDRRDLVHKHPQGWLSAHSDLVHQLRSTTMDFRFHLPFQWSCDTAIWDLHQKWVHTPTVTIVITPHSLALWCLLIQALQIVDRYPQWSLHVYCESFMHVKICDTWLQGLHCHCEDGKIFFCSQISGPEQIISFNKTTEKAHDDTHYVPSDLLTSGHTQASWNGLFWACGLELLRNNCLQFNSFVIFCIFVVSTASF